MSRGSAQGGLTVGTRKVRRELLDELEPADPRAIRSRRDLMRVNAVIGSCRILSGCLCRIAAHHPMRNPVHILELGAGDGSLALKLARRFATSWPATQLTLLDRQPLIPPTRALGFANLGWTMRPLILDALEWARAPTQQPLCARWNVILTNLFLHHFEEERLGELLSAAAARCDIFIACEPRRTFPALLGARLLPALGVSQETRYDAIVSVQAGFRDSELSQIWPALPGGWHLEERPAGLFSHLFVAVRGTAS